MRCREGSPQQCFQLIINEAVYISFAIIIVHRLFNLIAETFSTLVFLPLSIRELTGLAHKTLAFNSLLDGQ